MRDLDLTPQQWQRIINEKQAEIDRLTWLVGTLREEIRALTEPKRPRPAWPVPPDLEPMRPRGEM